MTVPSRRSTVPSRRPAAHFIGIRRLLAVALAVVAVVPVGAIRWAEAQVTFTPLPGNGLYVPLTPARILDTRTAIGGHPAPFAQAEAFSLAVAGVAGIPAMPNVSAVALNVTVTEPTLPGHLTVWPSDQPRVTTSNLNFRPGQTVPNMVIAKLSAGGRLSIFNSAGRTHVVVDVVGYFTDALFSPTGASYQGLPPSRLLDTRTGSAVGQQQTIGLNVLGVGGVPPADVTAVALNVTVDAPTAPSHLTVYPAGEGLPLASNLNYLPGQTVPNMVLAKVGAGGQVNFYNNAGSAHVIVDVVGYFTTTTMVGQQVALPPRRLLDTRIGLGAPTAKLGPQQTLRLRVTDIADVPATAISAVALNVTVDGPTAPSYLTVFPTGTSVPLASNLNFVAGQTVPNMVLATVGGDGTITIYNNAGSVDVIVDLVGYYTTSVPYPANFGRTTPLTVSEWIANPALLAVDGGGEDRDSGARASRVATRGAEAGVSTAAAAALAEELLDVGPAPAGSNPGALGVNGFAPNAVANTTGILYQLMFQNSNPANVQVASQCSATTVARNAVITAYHCVRGNFPTGFSFDSYLFAPGIHGVTAPFGYYLTTEGGWFLPDAQAIPDPFNLLDLYPPLDYAVIPFPPNVDSNPASTVPGDVVGWSEILMESPRGPRFLLGYPGEEADCNPVAPNGNTCLQQFCFTTVDAMVHYQTLRGGAEVQLDCAAAPGMSGGPQFELYRGAAMVTGVVSNTFGGFLYGPYLEYDPVRGDVIDLLDCAFAAYPTFAFDGCPPT